MNFRQERGCVQITSRSARATRVVPEEFDAARYADMLRLVLRTQPRSSRRFMVAMRIFEIVEASMNLSVPSAPCRQKKLGSADETSAARCWGERSFCQG